MNNKVVRLYTPPKPTLLDPHAQIKWIFFQVETEHDEPRAATFRYSKNKYIDFVNETHAYYPDLENDPRFYLEKHWETDALIRFNKWLSAQEIKSKTRYKLYVTVRQVMDIAYALRVIDTTVYHAPMFKGVPETRQRSAYAKREQEAINAAVAKWIGIAISVLRGYTPTGNGVPYRSIGVFPPINIAGQLYEIAEAAKEFGVDYSRITGRLRQGWTPQQAVGLEPAPGAPALHWILNGVVYQSMAAVAKAFGISSSAIIYRIKRGWTPEQVVGLTPKPEKKSSGGIASVRGAIVDGQEFKSHKAICRHYGADYQVVKARLTIGWTLREALGLDKREPYGTKIIVEDVEYQSINHAAAAYGLDHGVVGVRLRKGYSPEQAVGVVPMYVLKTDDRALLWMFEHEYGCDANAMFEDLHKRKNQLFNCCTEKGLLKLFTRWGVWPYIDDRLVIPLAVEMGMLTGLNAESLRWLEIDSFQVEHRLTGQPVITYRKVRSGTATRSEDRELHLAVLELGELYLDELVAEKIQRLMGLIIAITSKIRNDAPPELSRRLFIFQDNELSRKNGKRVIVAIDPRGKANTWYKRFCREEGLYDHFGPKFNFNISRCRPTLATNMVLAGADLFQVQVALGHESIRTTATYLDEQQMKPAFNRTVSEALKSISYRSREFQQCQQIADLTVQDDNEAWKLGFHETLSGCRCINPYRPSKSVRVATQLKEGAVCKYWNMCLLCDNAVITENSLPKLILYRVRVKAALNEGSPSIRARTDLYQDIVELIDGILEGDMIFPASVIEAAKCVAATMDDLLVDQLIYQGL